MKHFGFMVLTRSVARFFYNHNGEVTFHSEHELFYIDYKLHVFRSVQEYISSLRWRSSKNLCIEKSRLQAKQYLLHTWWIRDFPCADFFNTPHIKLFIFFGVIVYAKYLALNQPHTGCPINNCIFSKVHCSYKTYPISKISSLISRQWIELYVGIVVAFTYITVKAA